MSPQLPTVLLRAQTDERLARLAALGSERAFEAIVERYRRPLLGYARRIAGESRAEDIVQAAFLGAWGRLSAGAEVRDLRAWLFRIVHNGAINAVKRASASDVELFDDTPGTGDVHAEIERRDDVRRALDGIAALPLQQREALLGVAVQGRRHRDVGAELGVTDGAVRMLLHRARSTMRTAATALVPWPLAAWLSGSQAGAGGAGVSVFAVGGMKAAAVLSTAAVAVTAAPQISAQVSGSARAPAPAAVAVAPPSAAPPARAPAARPPAADRRTDRRSADASPADAPPAAPAPAPARRSAGRAARTGDARALAGRRPGGGQHRARAVQGRAAARPGRGRRDRGRRGVAGPRGRRAPDPAGRGPRRRRRGRAAGAAGRRRGPARTVCRGGRSGLRTRSRPGRRSGSGSGRVVRRGRRRGHAGALIRTPA